MVTKLEVKFQLELKSGAVAPAAAGQRCGMGLTGYKNALLSCKAAVRGKQFIAQAAKPIRGMCGEQRRTKAT